MLYGGGIPAEPRRQIIEASLPYQPFLISVFNVYVCVTRDEVQRLYRISKGSRDRERESQMAG